MDFTEAATRIVEAILSKEGGVALGGGDAADHDAHIKSVGTDAGAIYKEVYTAVTEAYRADRQAR